MTHLVDNSVDAVVTDPPYETNFMGKKWDASGIAYSQAVWREVMRVLKPGGHLLAFGGNRTYHRLACAIEDSGFEVRDCIYWVYGSGFPKSHDISKAIDKTNGRRFEDRFALGRHIRERREACGVTRQQVNDWLGATTKAEHFESDSPGFARVPTLADWHILQGRLGLSDEWTALVERLEAEREVVGQRPYNVPANHLNSSNFAEGAQGRVTLNITAPATDEARQWEGWGTALKPAVEPCVLCRKPLSEKTIAANVLRWGTGAINVDGCRVGTGGEEPLFSSTVKRKGGILNKTPELRDEWRTTAGRFPANLIHDGSEPVLELFPVTANYPGGDRSAARFFYCAKASSSERGEGNSHPTVKPLSLMRYLCRLITPPGGTVLDPFGGSGTTALAAREEGFSSILIEQEESYCQIITARLGKTGSSPKEQLQIAL